MNFYLASKPNDPFLTFFLSQTQEEVKSIVLRKHDENTLAKQISKMDIADTYINIVCSSDLSNYILNTPGLLERLSNNLENEYSIGIIPENDGTYLNICPIMI